MYNSMNGSPNSCAESNERKAILYDTVYIERIFRKGWFEAESMYCMLALHSVMLHSLASNSDQFS